MRNIEQERSRVAHSCVVEVSSLSSSKNEEIQKKYSSYVSKAPVLILMNGIGNTLMFFKSKIGNIPQKEIDEDASKKAYDLLYKHINGWLSGKYSIFSNFTSGKDTVDWISDEKTTTIHVAYATEETLRFLNWLKKFSDALLKKEESEEI